jgi:RNA polymerase II subunit A small phosphatase-like protein
VDSSSESYRISFEGDKSSSTSRHDEGSPRIFSHEKPRARLTVVLDLDDTLVVSFRKEAAPYPIRCGTGAAKHLVRHELQFGPGETIEASVKGSVIVVERPGLQEFLRRLKGFANVVLFTAGLRSYAEPILKRIDPAGELFSHVLYRDSTVNMSGQENVKDLSEVFRKVDVTHDQLRADAKAGLEEYNDD